MVGPSLTARLSDNVDLSTFAPDFLPLRINRALVTGFIPRLLQNPKVLVSHDAEVV